MNPPPPDQTYLTRVLLELLNTPSPTGFTEAAFQVLESELSALSVPFTRTAKGALLWTLEGRGAAQRFEGASAPPARICFASHLDTLGAMVKAIKPSGRLSFERIGGFEWASIEGEYARVHLEDGAVLTGTVVNTMQSYHVHAPKLGDLKRDRDTLELRLDARTSSAEETRALGVRVGDYVSWEARATLTDAGYVKGRHLDNKAAVAVSLALTKAVLEHGLVLEKTTHFFVSSFEEVGHGASSGLPEALDALVVVDMAAVGSGQNSSEHCVSLCHMDSSGPYSRGLSLELRRVADALNLDLRDDLYPHYFSDGSVARQAGFPGPVALIGPGVDASHAYERTHLDALEATYRLMLGYVLDGV